MRVARLLFAVALVVVTTWAHRPGAAAQPARSAGSSPSRLAFVGLHGGVFDVLKRYEGELGLQIEYIKDEQIAKETVDLADYRVVFLQHVRREDRDHWRRLIRAAKKRRPELRIVSISGLAEGRLPELAKAGMIEGDPKLRLYYGSSAENLRRLLIYVSVKYLGRPGKVLPPAPVEQQDGLFHPDHDGLFETVGEFLRWARAKGLPVDKAPRAIIAVHSTHLFFQQPKVVEALIRALEKRGVLAVAMIDYGRGYEARMLEFKPQVVIHTCHSRESVAFRRKLGCPHMHSIFFRKQSIDEWRQSVLGIAPNEMAFQVVGQELLGAIEPQIGAGTLQGGGSAEAFTPIPDRIEHLADRAAAWIRLARTPNRDKRVAIIYYDREMGKAELMRGSATGMFLNGPRSLVRVLKRMKEEGYRLSRLPADEDELVEWMMDHGRQIGVWAPGVLGRLARSGKAVLVPAETYRRWFKAKVPEKQRQELIKRWGEPPGRFLVWQDDAGRQFIVIPRIDLGNVILLPQPLRGEAHDTSLSHDKLTPPPHNYLATYFWLQEEFKAHAVVHFGTHGTEFILPGKAVGLSAADWPDIVMGSMPNINPWVINNLGESSPVRRRAYAVLVDHLVPPSVNAGLSDELLNLHNDIDKWKTLEPGALKEKFRAVITEQFRAAKLDVDLGIEIGDDRLLTPEEIDRVAKYLHDIYSETTPVSLHVLGEPPRKDLLVPWVVTCLRKRFLDALGEVIEVPPEENINEGDREKYLRRKAEELIELLLHRNLAPDEAVRAVGGRVPSVRRGSLPVRRGSLPVRRGSPDHAPVRRGSLPVRRGSPDPAESPDRQVSTKPARPSADSVGSTKPGRPSVGPVARSGDRPQPELPKPLIDGLKLARQLQQGFAQAPQEIDNLLAALNGRFIPPGPGNSPDRNPGALPTGRNMYVMNPEEVPSRPSWEIGKRLVDQLLAQQLKSKGRYPRKVAFTLNSFVTFQDYGVMESQILYLMGVRPVWDERNLVIDLEIIPAAELGRPRIDVFISALGYYRDMLPTRMRLLDKAVRLVASLDEPNNYVAEDSRRVKAELQKAGLDEQKAAVLSLARIFGAPPGQFGSAGYYYLVERSGEWDTREELMETYLSFSRYAYTDGLWGVEAAEAYNRHIQGTEVLLRSWSDRTRSPLSNKYVWYKGGSLSLAIKYLTGREPEWFLSDVRDPDRAQMVRAEDALRKDFRVRLFNRKWIEGMMKEGYAGADQIAVHVANTMGWKIMREGSVSDDIWEQIVDIYLRDSKKLYIREWFEAKNPFAFQEITEILLETIRKGYWQPDEETVREIAVAYAQSVARHGEGGGLRGGGNRKLERFVEKVLSEPGTRELDQLLAAYQAKVRESESPQEAASAPSTVQVAQAHVVAGSPDQATSRDRRSPDQPPDKGQHVGSTSPTDKSTPETPAAKQTEQVTGRELAPATATEPSSAAGSDYRRYAVTLALALVCLALVAAGYRLRRGVPGK